MLHRPRRLRKSENLRKLVRETQLHPNDFIYPLFVVPGQGIKKEIKSLPGNYHFSLDLLLKEIEQLRKLGLKAILLFGLPKNKDEQGSAAWSDEGIVQQAVKKIKDNFPDLEIITDICLCAYTSHGHCGLIKNKEIDNDATLKVLQKTALSHARAGADMLAPSDMMDGRIKAIREALDQHDFQQKAIMSYSVKYNSSFYGPFREAAHSSPSFGDRASYQMDPANSREALKEALLDQQEGTDILMVKPALAFLDIIAQVKENTNLPLAAYSVSGEYSMIKQMENEQEMMVEVLTSIKRAGADLIITYFAKDIISLL